MTYERNYSPSNNGRSSKELPIMRRCRSLSELPGHLRVPILHRKDTERTKARLEAGAAGVKELRALREQQQELIDQAMAAAQPKWKHPTLQRHSHSMTDHHRMQQYQNVEQQRHQVNNSFSTPLSTWHSACSLASISEEWDQTLNISTNTMGHSVNDNKTKITELRKSNHERNEGIQSQNFNRGRSQSVHGDFPYSPGANGNEFEQTASSPNGLGCSNNDLSLSTDVRIKDRKCRANSLDVYTNTHTNISDKDYQISSPRYSLRVRSQSMSWDNLLALIGLHSENNATINEPMEQDIEKTDDVFIDDNAVSQENTNYPAGLDDEYSQRKKMRSQSFTSGCSTHQDSGFRNLTAIILSPSNHKGTDNASSTGNIIDTNIQSESVQGHVYNQKKQNSEKLNSVSLLRRASIQCESVLTQTSTPRKIINPLQDVDINSLRSPGPLHAVTLQYSSMPMRELPTSKPKIVSSIRCVPGETSTLPNTRLLNAEVLSSSVATNASRTRNLITENDHRSKTLPDSKNKRMTFPECWVAEVTTKTASNEHPIPKPRTKIRNELTSQEANSQINSCLTSNADRKQNMTLEMLQKSSLNERSSSNHIESGRNTETESFTLAGFNPVGEEAQQNCSRLQSDKRQIDTVVVNERVKHTPQNDLSIQIDSSSVEKTTPDFKVNTDNRRNLQMDKSVFLTATDQNPLTRGNIHSPKDRSQIQSNPKMKPNQADCSKLILSPKSQPVHTRDVSVLSDEGYSTCDSTGSPQSQPSSVGSIQSCDTGSLSTGSLVNINGSVSYSSEKDKNCFLKQHTPSTMENYVKCERNLKNNSNTSVKESPRTKGLTGTTKVTTDQFQTYNDPHKRLEHNLCKTSKDKMVFHRCQTQVELAQQTNVANQQTSTSADIKMCSSKSNRVKINANETVAKTEKWTEFFEEVVPKLTQSYNPIQGTDTDTTKMFKQTSV